MATVTMTQFVDDLDDEPIEPDDVRTVSWTWMGVAYELDVAPANLERLEKGDVSVATLLQRSRRVGGRRLTLRATGGAPHASTSRSGTRARRDELNEIRDWARNNGYEVSDRGRVSRAIVAAYREAQQQ